MTRIPILAAFLVLSMLADGCSSQSRPAGLPPGIQRSSLPPFPVDTIRGASLLTATTLYGKDAEQRSPGADENGNALTLFDDSGGFEWGIWRFNPGRVPDHVDIDLSSTQGAWIGRANYLKGYWEFSGPFISDQTLPLDPVENVSSTGNIYIAIVCGMGKSATVQQLDLYAQASGWVRSPFSSSYLPLTTQIETPTVITNGVPAMCFVGDWEVNYVRALEPEGMNWNPVATLATLQSPWSGTCDLDIVDGNPAVSFDLYQDRQLKYLRGADASGSAWDPAVTVDSTSGKGGHNPSFLMQANGNPAIAYVHEEVINSDSRNRLIKFVRALDPQGMAWGAPQELTARLTDRFDNTTYEICDVVVANDYPAILYVFNDPNDGLDPDLRYLRAIDTNGSAWNPPVIIPVSPTEERVSLALVEGNPAISYIHLEIGTSIDRELSYLRADDAYGDTWGTPVVVDPGPTFPFYNSLAVIGGLPSIAYVNFDAGGQLKYVAALDVNGDVWGTPEVVDSSIGIDDPAAPCLLEVQGLPAISYYIDDKLRFSIRFP